MQFVRRCYSLRGIYGRFDSKINRIGRPIRFEIRFERKKTIRRSLHPMLSDRCLSVTMVYCGKMVGWMKMKLGTQVGLGPGHIVLDGDPAPPTQRGTTPADFSAYICCGQMAG